MIKITSSICGTIVSNALVTTNEKGVTALEFTMRVEIPSRSKGHSSVDVLVVVNDSNHEHIKDYCNGNRIVMNGAMTVKKADDTLVFILRDAQPQITYGVPADDYIKGDLSFTGKVYNVSERMDKRGRNFLVMSASSPIKAGHNQWDYIWVNFLRFTSKMVKAEDLVPDWLVSGVSVEILGDFQVTSYNKRIGISSRVVEMCQKETVEEGKNGETEEVAPF